MKTVTRVAGRMMSIFVTLVLFRTRLHKYATTNRAYPNFWSGSYPDSTQAFVNSLNKDYLCPGQQNDEEKGRERRLGNSKTNLKIMILHRPKHAFLVQLELSHSRALDAEGNTGQEPRVVPNAASGQDLVDA